jgi:hypothetical protein
MSFYRQTVPESGLAIERATENAPDDKYYVLRNGEVVASYRSLKQAQKKYEEILATLDLPDRPREEAEKKPVEPEFNFRDLPGYWGSDRMGKVRRFRQGKTRTYR